MSEGRAKQYGRFLAKCVNSTIELLPENRRDSYKSRFITELHKNADNELKDIFYFDIIENPEQYARLIKEGLALMSEETRDKAKNSLLDNL